MDRDRELGKLQRYTDLMKGDLKNALHTANRILAEGDNGSTDAYLRNIKGNIEDIQGLLDNIQEHLKLCTTTEN